MTIDQNWNEHTDKILKKPDDSTDGVNEHSQCGQNSDENYTKLIKDSSLRIYPLYEIYTDLKADIQQRESTPKYKSGLFDLDRKLLGLHKKQMLTIKARTSQGKSAFALQIATSLADCGNKVVYFSLEMSKEQLLERMLSSYGRIDNFKLRSGQLGAKMRVKDIDKSFSEWIGHLKMVIDDQYGFDYATMVEMCQITNPDFVVLDYIQMVSIKGFNSKVNAIEEYVRKLKQLSITMDFGVILLSQINKDEITKWASMVDEHSDTLLVPEWDWEQGVYIVKIPKQRHGSPYKGVVLKFLPEYSLFEDNLEHKTERDRLMEFSEI